jgi:dihydrofolate synthase/folylpolyglutamate synthase
VTERVCVDGEPVTLDEMEAAAARITPLRPEIDFSYFEAITTIAFLVFAARGVDVAVLETGLGGRFDATNVTRPDATVIASISLDHRRLLGDTVEEILLEKLGITRPGVPLLIGTLPERLEAIARERGKRDGFTVETAAALAHVDVARAGAHGTDLSVRTAARDYGEVRVPFGGAHQVTNAVLALSAAERVAGPLERVREGLANAYMPGRFERFEIDGKTYVLDVAHNEAALETSLAQIGTLGGRERTTLVFGLMRRKELFDVPRRALEAASRIYLAIPTDGRLKAPEANEPHELLAQYLFRHLTDARADVILWNRRSPGDDTWRRLADALASPANPAEVVLVTGSHHVVEEFGRALFERGGGG